MKLVSIIIPVYNVAPYIERSLNSALDQTYKNIEYIIVDDCSVDESLDIVERVKNEHSKMNIQIVKHSHNKGPSGVRNTGIETATGEYIFFMDADDFLVADCIERHIAAITMYDADMTDGCFMVIGGRNMFNEVQKLTYTCNNKEILSFYFKNILHISACNKLIKSSFIREKELYFTEKILYEDVEYTFLLAKYASSVVLIPDQTYQYIIRGDSIINSFSDRHIESTLYLNRVYLEYINRCQDDELKNLARKYLSELRFKISTRIIISSGLTLERKKECYNIINATEYRNKGWGIYGIFTRFPFWPFFLLFFLPRSGFDILLFCKRKLERKTEQEEY